MMQSHVMKIEDLEDRSWRQKESRDMEDGYLLNKRMKDDKITVTGDDTHVSTQAIYFARWPVNGIGRGQHGVVSTVLRALPFRTSYVFGVRHMMRMRIPSITNNKGWGGVYGLGQERIRMGSLSKTPIEAHSLVKNSLNTGNVLATMAYV